MSILKEQKAMLQNCFKILFKFYNSFLTYAVASQSSGSLDFIRFYVRRFCCTSTLFLLELLTF